MTGPAMTGPAKSGPAKSGPAKSAPGLWLIGLWSRGLSALGWFLRVLIRGYQLCLSSVMPPSCRFTPTCSDFACQAVTRHGPFVGAGLAVWRILRCNPWNRGGDDPVPEQIPTLFQVDRARPLTGRGRTRPMESHGLVDRG